MNNFRIVVLLALIAFSTVMTGCGHSEKEEALKKFASLNPSGDFTLEDQDGQEFHLKDHRGKSILLFFGYLTCPDVCPTTLSKLTRVYKMLGPEGEKVLTVFVSVDPERDTPPKLKEYLEYFKVKSIGLTGTKAQVDSVVAAYGASYEKVYTHGKDYLMNHSDYLYLIDGDGKVRHLFHPEDKADKIVDVIKKTF
jgi:protein SCO1/2